MNVYGAIGVNILFKSAFERYSRTLHVGERIISLFILVFEAWMELIYMAEIGRFTII